MKNGRILMPISLLVIVSTTVAVPCLRVNPWLCDIEEVFEAFEQRREASLRYMEEIEFGQPSVQMGGNYKVSSRDIQLRKTELGIDVTIPVHGAEASKIDVAHTGGKSQEDDAVMVHVPLQNGSLDVRFGSNLMQIEHKVEEKTADQDHAAKYCSVAQSRFGRSLPVHIDLKSVDVTFDKATESLRLTFLAKKVEQGTKIFVKGIDDAPVVVVEEAALTEKQQEDFDLK